MFGCLAISFGCSASTLIVIIITIIIIKNAYVAPILDTQILLLYI